MYVFVVTDDFFFFNCQIILWFGEYTSIFFRFCFSFTIGFEWQIVATVIQHLTANINIISAVLMYPANHIDSML